MQRLLDSEIFDVKAARIKRLSGTLRVAGEEERPQCWTFEDLWAVPGFTGLYDGAGIRIDEASNLYVTDTQSVAARDKVKFERKRLVRNPGRIDLDAIVARHGGYSVRTRPTLFLGAYAGHYGHFLTDHCCRLWAGGDGTSGQQRVFIPFSHGELARGRDYVAQMLSVCGATDAASDPLTAPTLFRRITVPEPALQGRHLIFRNADTAHLAVADRLLAGSDNPYRGKKIYLSRARLSGGLRRVSGEERIERLFTDLGYEVVYPELVTFLEQVRIFNAAETIAGLMGSAFHTGLFSRPDYTGRLVVICGDEPLNARLILQNAIKSYRCAFVGGYQLLPGEAGAVPVVHPDLERLRANLAEAGVA